MGSVGSRDISNLITNLQEHELNKESQYDVAVNPIPQAPKDVEDTINKTIAGMAWWLDNWITKHTKTESVNIQELKTLQSHVLRDKLREMSQSPAGNNFEQMIVYKYKNNYYVDDGNHRLAIEYLKGTKSKKIPVIDFKDVVNEIEDRKRKGKMVI